MNPFAPYSKNPNCFIVQNLTQNKCIMIFNYPINPGCTRDLLRIEGLDEGDIRGSLLKGELRNKILAGEITVLCSDIDLTQYNATQKAFLQMAGITTGLAIGSPNITAELNVRINSGGGGGLTPDQHEQLRQLIHFIDQGPGHGFASGAYKVVIGQPFPTSIVWYSDISQTQMIVSKSITYNINKTINTETWNMYDTDGITSIQTIIDTFSYTNNVFESSRTRTIL